ncbi:hypothetical protein AGMMS49957_17320 [Synergistales bacterium]|nr:hypothetical protein AGMMS49957_17320 [Synergistales bacterium]
MGFMKISTKGRYALRMLLDIAEHESEGYVSLKEVAERQGISKNYLEQIIMLLKNADILRTACLSRRSRSRPTREKRQSP